PLRGRSRGDCGDDRRIPYGFATRSPAQPDTCHGLARRDRGLDETSRRAGRPPLAEPRQALPGAAAEGTEPFSWTRGGGRSVLGDVRWPDTGSSLCAEPP